MKDRKLKKISVKTALLSLSLVLCSQAVPVWADGENSVTAVNTGDNYTGNVVGNNNQVGNDININGNAENVNHNTTGNNDNRNQLSVYNPNGGGSAALVMPRNSMSLANSLVPGQGMLGLRMGVNSNPIPFNNGGGGGLAGMGWYAELGFNKPIGKIPSWYKNRNSGLSDDARQLGLDRDRNVFGQLQPTLDNTLSARTSVGGRVIGLNAYNYATVPTGKIGGSLPSGIEFGKDGGKPYQPKLLALAAGDVFTRPLNTGEKEGVVEVGKEYPYLGHIRAEGGQPAWIKILMPNGTEGWVSTRFEFVKTDFTEVDDLAVAPPPKAIKVTQGKMKPIKLSQVPKKRYTVTRQQ